MIYHFSVRKLWLIAMVKDCVVHFSEAAILKPFVLYNVTARKKSFKVFSFSEQETPLSKHKNHLFLCKFYVRHINDPFCHSSTGVD